MEILTIHEVVGKRLIALPEECLPIAREVMVVNAAVARSAASHC
jgi:hypothetical protein